jgi:hypothetical protein
MKKHKSVHLADTKPCRYFISQTKCPFEPIDCKFRHSEIIPLNESQKTDVIEDDVEDLETDDEIDDEPIPISHQCVVCWKLFGSREDMVQHCLFNHPIF